MNVLITKTLTLPDVTADEASMIQEAAGPDSVVNIVDSPKAGMVYASEADVILGITPKWLFEEARNLKWVHATASGVDNELQWKTPRHLVHHQVEDLLLFLSHQEQSVPRSCLMIIFAKPLYFGF